MTEREILFSNLEAARQALSSWREDNEKSQVELSQDEPMENVDEEDLEDDDANSFHLTGNSSPKGSDIDAEEQTDILMLD